MKITIEIKGPLTELQTKALRSYLQSYPGFESLEIIVKDSILDQEIEKLAVSLEKEQDSLEKKFLQFEVDELVLCYVKNAQEVNSLGYRHQLRELISLLGLEEVKILVSGILGEQS